MIVPQTAPAEFQVKSSTTYTIVKKMSFDRNTKYAGTAEVSIPLLLNSEQDGSIPYLKVDEFAISPKPDDIREDDKGNRAAVFRGFEHLEIIQIAKFEGKTVKFIPGIYADATKFTKYLKPTERVESDNPAIIKKALEVTAGKTSPYEKAKAVYGFVQSYMNYSHDDTVANKGALSALNTGKGVCEDHADLMVALLRASGIPARVANGYVPREMYNVLNQEEYITSDGGIWLERDNCYNSVHSWVEYYLENEGWIPCETSTSANQNGRIIWDNFYTMEADWIYIPHTYDSRSHEEWINTVKKLNSLIIYKGEKTIPSSYTFLKCNTETSGDFPVFLRFKGQDTAGDTTPVLIKNWVYVPLRKISELNGAVVSWTPEKIWVSKTSTVIEIVSGSNLAKINNKETIMDMPLFIKNNRIMVPLSWLADILNIEFGWDEKNRIVNII
jgi:hypothetical protein